MIFALCCVCAFVAGLVDSVVGGGGLILIPGLLILMPQVAVATVIGTNKLAASLGTVVSTTQYARRVRLEWSVLIPAAMASFVCAIAGARVISLIPPIMIRPLVLALLVAVALYTFFRKDLGSLHAPKLKGTRERVTAIGVGALLGFYDGFFGPGTGSFLIFIFVGVFGFEFLAASASAKLLNLASNLAALFYFMGTGQVIYGVGFAMAICNIFGALTGTHLALLKGSRFVRIFFLVVVSVIILKLAWDTFHG